MKNLWVYEHELADGRIFTVDWVVRVIASTWDDPEDEIVSEPHYTVDGCGIPETEIPEEITQEMLEDFWQNAKVDPTWDFGGVD